MNQRMPLRLRANGKAAHGLFFATIWIGLIIFGLIYGVNSNLQDAGVVVDSRPYPIQSLPAELRPYLNLQEEPVLLILDRPYPSGVTIPESVQPIAAITVQAFPRGTVVELVNPVVDWTVDSREFPFSAYFERLLISDNVRVISPLEASIELGLLSPAGLLLWGLALAVYYAGPTLFVLVSYVLDRRPTFFGLISAASGYALLVLLSGIFAIEHHVYLPYPILYFGYSFPAFVVLSILVLRFERTEHGKRVWRTLWGMRQED